MNFLFWFLKITLLAVLIFFGNALLDTIGSWSLPACIFLFLLGNWLINKMMENYNKRNK